MGGSTHVTSPKTISAQIPGVRGSCRFRPNGGPILVRELGQRLGFSELMRQHLTDARGKNTQAPLAEGAHLAARWPLVSGVQDYGCERAGGVYTARVKLPIWKSRKNGGVP